jgi:hypothetical protein
MGISHALRRAASPPPAHGGNFFVDSIGEPARQQPVETEHRLSEVLIFAIALATAIGAAGVFGLLRLLLVTAS